LMLQSQRFPKIPMYLHWIQLQTTSMQALDTVTDINKVHHAIQALDTITDITNELPTLPTIHLPKLPTIHMVQSQMIQLPTISAHLPTKVTADLHPPTPVTNDLHSPTIVTNNTIPHNTVPAATTNTIDLHVPPETALIVRIDKSIKLPYQATPDSSGFDIQSTITTNILPGKRKLIPLGIRVRPPDGCYTRIASISSLANHHGLIVNGGVIDHGYTGELHALMINISHHGVMIHHGDRIGQLIFERSSLPLIVETHILPSTI
jgi:dUTP pyrophosphatase